MKKYWKTIEAISFIFIMVVLFGSFGFSQEKKETVPQKDMMKEMMGNMDKTMEQCSKMMDNMNMMMGKNLTPGCMGMMNVNGMGMMMHNMSQNMKSMMENMDSMMKNQVMMKDDVMKKNMETMQEHMKMMTENMQDAMNSMEEMTKRMEEMQVK